MTVWYHVISFTFSKEYSNVLQLQM
jgi:hypothetical protein